MKHTTTLSTGSILIVAGFIEKLFPDPKSKLLVVLSLGCFFLSIIAAFSAGFMYIAEGDPAGSDADGSRNGLVYVVLATFLCFIFGIIFFMIFALANLFF